MEVSGTKNLPWNKDTVYALGLYKLIGRSLGIWPLECHDFGSNIRFIVVVVLQLVMNYNLIQEFVKGCVSIYHAVDFIGVLGTTSVSLLKISVIRVCYKKMSYIMKSMLNDWSIVNCEKYHEIMRKHALFGTLVTIFQFSTASASAVLIVIMAPPSLGQSLNETLQINNSNITKLYKNIPMGSGCSVVDTSTFWYLTFYFFQLIQLIILCLCSVGIDSIFFGIAMHICAQLKILNHDIAQLGHNSDDSNVRKMFISLIERHKHLFVLAKFLEDIFHPIILGQLAASGLHITLLGVEMLFGLRDGDYSKLVYSAVTISLLLLQLYIYCYAGDYLASQMKEIRDAAYNCCWYNFSPSFAKDVMFVLVRSNRLFNLTAGKMFCMNIHSFAILLKTMMSCFSVLKLTIVE